MGLQNLEAVAQAAGIEADVLKSAIESEEAVSVELNQERVVYNNKEDFQTYVDNYAKEKSTAAIEIAVKTARNEMGLEFQGKTIENLITAVKEKTLQEANIEPNQKIEGLSKDLETLRGQLAKKDEEFTSLQERYRKEGQVREVNNMILDALPKEGTVIGNQELLTLFKASHEVDITDEGIMVKKEGNVLKDDLMRVKGIKDVINDFVQPYIKKPEGGRDKGTEKGQPKPGSLEEFTARMEKEGIRANTQEFNHKMSAAIKDGTLTI